MTSRVLSLIVGGVALSATAYLLIDSIESTPAPAAASSAAQSTVANLSDSGSKPHFAENHVPSAQSPFSGAVTSETTLAQQRLEAREKQMAKGGYGTPAEYFHLPLSKLKELAAKGDMFALIQLGQQYWDESSTIASDPTFDTSAPPNKLAVEYMSRAVMAGATQPALTLATRLAASEPSESYAWALFAEKLQVGGAAELAAKLRTRLSAPDIDAARLSAEQKLNQMTQATMAADSATARAP
ncbi:MAG TPA: hypothetical protein VF670_10560 [Duganella sp.]|jgi:hypothetical protein